jgi:curved DNA-binding protein CbpA
MQDETNHYRTLQVDPSANDEVIRAAYRVLARRFHPDLAGNDAMMKRLNAAWEILGDPARRAEYERSRTASPAPAAAPAKPASPDHAGPPVGTPSGTVLTYGRYEGWSLGQIAFVDPDFLEWLRSVPGGRYLRPEIDAILREVRGPRRFESRWGGATSASAPRFRGAGARG